MQRQRMMIARTNSWITGANLSTIVFEIALNLEGDPNGVIFSKAVKTFIIHFANKLHVPKKEFNEIFCEDIWNLFVL